MTSWLKLSFSIPAALEDDLIACLYAEGTIGIETTRGVLEAYFPEDFDPDDLERRVAACLGQATASLGPVGRALVPDGAWHERWVSSLRPFPLGEKFLVAPGLADPREAPGRMVIRLTPGRAFGTGEHATTRVCVELLEREIDKGDRLIDIGTGSGILAIVGRLLGAGRVVALDLDETAIQSARSNASLNGALGVEFVVGGPEALRGARSDVIAANLSGTSLVKLMPELARLTARAAILSGILIDEEQEVQRAAQSAGFVAGERRADGEWLGLLVKRG